MQLPIEHPPDFAQIAGGIISGNEGRSFFPVEFSTLHIFFNIDDPCLPVTTHV